MRRMQLLMHCPSHAQTRYVVEGEAGMGKTRLASKLAHSWAEGKDERMQQFQLVLLVQLADFHKDLESYIMEKLMPSYSDKEA